jgi:riboflavin synthase alpha subunit
MTKRVKERNVIARIPVGGGVATLGICLAVFSLAIASAAAQSSPNPTTTGAAVFAGTQIWQ